MVSQGTRHSVGTRMHSLATLAYTSAPLALTGCLLWEVKVVGSGWGLASSTDILGKGSAVSLKHERANIVFCESFFQTMTTFACLCMSLHKNTPVFKFERGSLRPQVEIVNISPRVFQTQRLFLRNMFCMVNQKVLIKTNVNQYSWNTETIISG